MAKLKKDMTSKEREALRIERLGKALRDDGYVVSYGEVAKEEYAALRAIVFAVVPGRQKARNIEDLLDTATTAHCRSIRKRDKA